MDHCFRWGVRTCSICQVRKASRHTVRWAVLTMSFPNPPGIVVGADVFGPLPLTARGCSHILPFTDRFSRRQGCSLLVLPNKPPKAPPTSLSSGTYITFVRMPDYPHLRQRPHTHLQTLRRHLRGLGHQQGDHQLFVPSATQRRCQPHYLMAQTLAIFVNERQNDGETLPSSHRVQECTPAVFLTFCFPFSIIPSWVGAGF